MLVWLDLETTGLKATNHHILEVAAIVTDDDLREVARMQRVVYYPHAATIVELLDEGRDYGTIHAAILRRFEFGATPDEYVLAMHDKNGLWRDCVNGLALDTVDRDLAAFVTKYGVKMVVEPIGPDGTSLMKRVTPQLAGSTISFDRAFINAYLPRLASEDVLHYRNLDVSTFNETARRFWKDVHKGRPNAGRAKELAAHRGMADIEESIATFKYYLENLSPRSYAIEAP